MPRSFLQRLLEWNKRGSSVQALPSTNGTKAADRAHPNSLASSGPQNSTPDTEGKSLFAFVDLKDPFVAGEIAGEALPGPILSIMSARKFDSLFLFHTPHTRENAVATLNEVNTKHPTCKVTLHELPVSDPKDYSSLMGTLCRYLRDLAVSPTANIDFVSPAILHSVRAHRSGNNYVCVSSGTAEMRAAWFLVTAVGLLPAKLLHVGSPAYPLFGEVNVKEVRIETTDWETIRNLLMPAQYFGLERARTTIPRSRGRSAPEEQRRVADAMGRREAQPEDMSESLGWRGEPKVEVAAATLQSFESLSVPGLDEALQELGVHVGSAVLRHAAERAGIAAGSHLPVLLLGETGTGKERFAHLIHRLSSRSCHDMVAINCAAIPKDIAESYLFGHTKGAFSGATGDKKGMFESADHSTLFLDEIAELTLEVQAKLLRVIQDGSVQRLGSVVPRKVDVRIIAATNRNLRSEVATGRFREDLYFRLEVVQIKLPALRDRRNEIPELALILLRQINQKRQKPLQLSKGALQRLEQYDWPGNVRQLSNVLERSVLYARAEVIDADDLLIADDAPARDLFAILPEPAEGFSIEEYLAKARKQLFLRALAKCQNNQTEAALLLGVSKQAVSKFVAGASDNTN